MEPSTVFNAKVYVFHVKEVGTKDWDANDLIYGLCMEDERLNHSRFKKLCNDNGRYFFSKTVNLKDKDGKVEPSCTWAQIQETMKDWTPVGSPLIVLSEAPTSFSVIASSGYEKGIFTNEDVRKRYFGGGVKKEIYKGSNSKPDTIDPKTIVKTAIQKSNAFSKEKQSAEGLSQSAQILTGNFSNYENSLSNRGEISLESCSYEDLLDLAYEYKEKYDAAESRAAILQAELSARDFRVQDLEAKLADANSNLKEATNAQAKFMAAGDNLAAEKKILIEGISHDIAESLKPKIKQQMEACNADMKKKMETQFKDINENTARLGKNVLRAQSEIETVADLVQTVISALSNADNSESNDEVSPSVGTTTGGDRNASENALPLNNTNNNHTIMHVPPYPPQIPFKQGPRPAQTHPQGPPNQNFNRKLYKRFKAANRIVNQWNKHHSNSGPQSGFHLPPPQMNPHPTPQHALESTPMTPYHSYGQHSVDPNFTDPRMNTSQHGYSGEPGHQWN